jgi:pyruvate/2-oxoglutarate dehydrogenase complex dihydrolipoamide acyltransferase (E2) component
MEIMLVSHKNTRKNMSETQQNLRKVTLFDEAHINSLSAAKNNILRQAVAILDII